MQLAYQHPELCERLVLVGSGGLGREVSWMLRLLTLPGAEYVMPVLFPRFARRRGEKVVAFFRDRGMRAPHVAEMWSAYASLTETENRHAFIRTLRAVIDAAAAVGRRGLAAVGLETCGAIVRPVRAPLAAVGVLGCSSPWPSC